jgi:hypothetical protein
VKSWLFPSNSRSGCCLSVQIYLDALCPHTHTLSPFTLFFQRDQNVRKLRLNPSFLGHRSSDPLLVSTPMYDTVSDELELRLSLIFKPTTRLQHLAEKMHVASLGSLSIRPYGCSSKCMAWWKKLEQSFPCCLPRHFVLNLRMAHFFLE